MLFGRSKEVLLNETVLLIVVPPCALPPCVSSLPPSLLVSPFGCTSLLLLGVLRGTLGSPVLCFSSSSKAAPALCSWWSRTVEVSHVGSSLERNTFHHLTQTFCAFLPFPFGVGRVFSDLQHCGWEVCMRVSSTHGSLLLCSRDRPPCPQSSEQLSSHCISRDAGRCWSEETVWSVQVEEMLTLSRTAW